MDIWKPDVFTLGPGGTKGYLELGLMKKFQEEDYLDQTTTFVGCSVGSAILLLYLCNYSMVEIIDDSIDLNLINGLEDINLDKYKEKPGILNSKTIETILRNKIIDKFSYIPTLKQLYDITNKLFYIITYNIDKEDIERLSYITHPDLSCLEAIMMSMAIPLLVCPRIYKGNVYIDGAVAEPHPILFLDNGINKILGVYIDSERSYHSSDRNYLRYIYRAAQASMNMLRKLAIQYSSANCKHIGLKSPVIDMTGITLTKPAKMEMVTHGYQEAEMFLIRLKDPEKYKIILNDTEEIPNIEDVINCNEPSEEHHNDFCDEKHETLNDFCDEKHETLNDLFVNDI